MSESPNWSKRNEAEIKETIEQIKAMKPTIAIVEGSTVFFHAESEQEEIGLSAWDAAVALCLVMEISIEYT